MGIKIRYGLTLLEVLMAIFIMGIGMLSVLAMFPAAADMMGRAKKNYETAEALVNASAINDGVDFFSSYKSLLTPPPGGFDPVWNGSINNSGNAMANAVVGAGKVTSIVVSNPGSGYARPPAVLISGGGGGSGALGLAVLGVGTNADKVIAVTILEQGNGYTVPPTVTFTEDYSRYCFIDQRLGIEGGFFGNVPVVYVNSSSAQDRFFTLNSDLPLDEFGRAEKPAQSLGKYTISYLLEKPKPATTPNFIRRYAMVFKERDTSKVNPLPDHKNRYFAKSDYLKYPSSVTLTGASSQAFSKRQWLMLTVENTGIPAGAGYPPTHVRFVEIRSINEVVNASSPGGYDVDLEISPPLIQDINAAYHLLDVVWVAYLGL